LRASSPGLAAASRSAHQKEDEMATRSHHHPTTAERDARRREQLDRLRGATDALLTSEGWQRWLRTRSRFHRYSLRNTLLIAFQCPHATHVAGFRQWLELGRCVRKGEKAIRIFAPVRYRRPDEEQTDDKQTEPQLVGFRLAAVFDVSQTGHTPESSRHHSIHPANRSAATATNTCSTRSNSTPPRSASTSTTSPLSARPATARHASGGSSSTAGCPRTVGSRPSSTSLPTPTASTTRASAAQKLN
jgi:hypothetical protein